MTEKVVSIKGDPIKDLRQVYPEVVDMLKNLLHLAETGELVGFAGVAEYYDAKTQAWKSGVVSHSMIGRWESMKGRIIVDLGGT